LLLEPQFLDEERASLSRLAFASEYGCEFVDTEDAVFRYDDIMGAVVDVAPLWGGHL